MPAERSFSAACSPRIRAVASTGASRFTVSIRLLEVEALDLLQLAAAVALVTGGLEPCGEVLVELELASP